MRSLIRFLLLAVSSVATFREVYKWKQMTFNWPDESTKMAALENGDYIASNNIPIAVEKWKDKLFVTLPR